MLLEMEYVNFKLLKETSLNCKSWKLKLWFEDNVIGEVWLGGIANGNGKFNASLKLKSKVGKKSSWFNSNREKVSK